MIAEEIRLHSQERYDATAQYNILYIHSHDSERYLQPYGYAIPTPNLQALAEQGVLFSVYAGLNWKGSYVRPVAAANRILSRSGPGI